MRHAPNASNPRRLGLALAAAGLALTAVPALAQTVDYGPTVDELTVTGRLGPAGEPQLLSRAVSISDLDLRSDAGVREMQRRVRATARQLCDELGETGVYGSAPSCVDAAVRDAQRQTRVAVAQARAPTYYAYVGPTYVAPAYAPAYVVPGAPYAGYYAPPASAVIPAAP
jgi:UrcA family protein